MSDPMENGFTIRFTLIVLNLNILRCGTWYYVGL